MKRVIRNILTFCVALTMVVARMLFAARPIISSRPNFPPGAVAVTDCKTCSAVLLECGE